MGKRDPESGVRMGCAFLLRSLAETASQIPRSERDALFGRLLPAHMYISARHLGPAQIFLPLLRHFTDRSVVCPHARVYSKRYFSYAIRCRLGLHDPKGAVMERILGVNLSGWFIPEPWVTPSLYAATGASNAAELQEAMGTAAYNERMRRHYETFVSLSLIHI